MGSLNTPRWFRWLSLIFVLFLLPSPAAAVDPLDEPPEVQNLNLGLHISARTKPEFLKKHNSCSIGRVADLPAVARLLQTDGA